jgi:glycosyltransferase involved in cell wall biosynthesis
LELGITIGNFLNTKIIDMKVLVIPEYGSSGGSLSFLKRLLDVHSKFSIETAILIQKNQAREEMLELFKKLDMEVYIGPNRGSIFRKDYLSILYDFLFCWKAYTSFKPDLIVVSNASCGLMLGSLLYPKPVVFIMHTYPDQKMRGGMRAYVRWFNRASNRFVAVSKFSAGNVSKFMEIPEKLIQVIYNSYQEVKGSEESNLEENKAKVVLTIGHVTEYKNPETWLKVAASIIKQKPEVKFIWLGDGPLLDSMRVKVQELSINNVFFLGHCNNVSSYYEKAAVYFQPSLRESHGIAVVEAMSHKLPCITSNIGGLPESVVDGLTGFTCQPNDVESFCLRIIELLENPDGMREMGRAGGLRAQSLFSESIQDMKIIDLYNEVLNLSNVGERMC